MQFLPIKHRFAIFAALLLMAFSPVLWAHAKLQKSTPAADATLKESPKNIRLEFNEKLEPAFSAISISTVQGQKIASDKAVLNASDTNAMTLTLPALEPGYYQVNWIAVTIDGHRVKGSYMFMITK